MFLWLYEYLTAHHIYLPGLNLLKYLTFRGGMAEATTETMTGRTAGGTTKVGITMVLLVVFLWVHLLSMCARPSSTPHRRLHRFITSHPLRVMSCPP